MTVSGCSTKVVPIYEQYSEEVYGEWFKIKSEFEQSTGMSLSDTQKWIDNPKAMFWSLLIGIDSDVLAAYTLKELREYLMKEGFEWPDK